MTQTNNVPNYGGREQEEGGQTHSEIQAPPNDTYDEQKRT